MVKLLVSCSSSAKYFQISPKTTKHFTEKPYPNLSIKTTKCPTLYRENNEIIFCGVPLKQPKQHHVAMEPIYCMNWTKILHELSQGAA
jgi:hypothetical protein